MNKVHADCLGINNEELSRKIIHSLVVATAMLSKKWASCEVCGWKFLYKKYKKDGKAGKWLLI